MTPADERRWRELLQSFLASLMGGLDAIKEQIKSISEQSQSQKETREVQTQRPPSLRAELALPPTITDNYEASQHEQQRIEREKLKLESRKVWLEACKLIVEVLVFIGVAATLVVAYQQWQAMLDSNKLTREALEGAQRAVVFSDAPEWLFDALSVRMRVYNTGKIPTGPFTVKTAQFRRIGDKVIPATKETVYRNFGPDRKRIPPGSHISYIIPILGVSTADVAAIKSGQQSIDFSVDIFYDDGFGKPGFSRHFFTYKAGLGWYSNRHLYDASDRKDVVPMPNEY